MAASPNAPSSGKITRGITKDTFINQTIQFVEGQLHLWRDDTTRPAAEAEEDLNGQLCKHLNDRARDDFPMALFHHEEKQGARRRVDVSVCPSSEAIEASLYESIYDPYLVIEGKRLPAPSSDREREYLTGFEEQSGGVQRFRLCLHGRGMSVAVMVGYVQHGEASEWLDWINKWIDDLEQSGADSTCSWSKRDHLCKLKNDGQTNAARCESGHARVGGQNVIRLIHLWIVIAKRKKPGKRKKSLA